MAKVAFSKLNLKIDSSFNTILFNNQEIQVKNYLPINDKLALISDIINQSSTEEKYANPVQVEVYTAINIIEYYTNINFTEKQKEDMAKLYDMIFSTGFYNEIINAIPSAEYNKLINDINISIEAIYKYQNSVLGIINNVANDYENLNLDASVIQEKLADDNNMQMLKDVLTKLG